MRSISTMLLNAWPIIYCPASTSLSNTRVTAVRTSMLQLHSDEMKSANSSLLIAVNCTDLHRLSLITADCISNQLWTA